jgi:glutamyl-tRNA reductase
MAARRNRPLFLVDIAVPRDVDADVEQLENVYLYNIDHIESIVRENLRQRELELSRCQAIIGGHVQEFLERVAARPAGRPTQPAASPQPAFHLFQPAPYAS